MRRQRVNHFTRQRLRPDVGGYCRCEKTSFIAAIASCSLHCVERGRPLIVRYCCLKACPSAGLTLELAAFAPAAVGGASLKSPEIPRDGPSVLPPRPNDARSGGAIAIAIDAAQRKRKPYDGAVGLGCVIRGETIHFEIVSMESSRGLMDLAVSAKFPIGNGILTVNTEEQAWARARANDLNKGGDAARAALAMLRIKRRLAKA